MIGTSDRDETLSLGLIVEYYRTYPLHIQTNVVERHHCTRLERSIMEVHVVVLLEMVHMLDIPTSALVLATV